MAEITALPTPPKRRRWKGIVAAIVSGILGAGGSLAATRAADAHANATQSEAQPTPATKADVQAVHGLVTQLAVAVRALTHEVREIQDDRTYQRGRADEAREARERRR